MPGPDPKYTAEERAAQGNPGQRPTDIVTPSDGIIVAPPLDHAPPVPDHLHSSTDAGGLAMNAWRQLAPLLVDARALREGDEASLMRYCRYLAEWVVFTKQLDEMGMVLTQVSEKTGERSYRNPAFTMRQQNETALQALEKELGLSPKARIEVQKKLMAALRDLPNAERGKDARKSGGPVGFLNDDSDDDE